MSRVDLMNRILPFTSSKLVKYSTRNIQYATDRQSEHAWDPHQDEAHLRRKLAKLYQQLRDTKKTLNDLNPNATTKR